MTNSTIFRGLGKKTVVLLVSLLMMASALVVFAASSSELKPISDGSYRQWTPKSGTVHFTMVDEAVCNGETDYNYTNIVGQRDSYFVNLASIPNGSKITEIAITPCASKNKSGKGTVEMDVFYRFTATRSFDAGDYLLTDIKPIPKPLPMTVFSSLSYTKNASSSLELGVVYSSGTKGVRLSNVFGVLTYTAPTPTPTPTSSISFSRF